MLETEFKLLPMLREGIVLANHLPLSFPPWALEPGVNMTT